ncbi:hypothetical protein [Paenibacillus sp. 1-18]|uniref:hypothetical protein n=1 Tax=Paenibacillus sp. 1-18 TaxID=1333846 RepID=UPI00046F5366|nr:hypothetical protein [Paenibacillus sp. 1-18]
MVNLFKNKEKRVRTGWKILFVLVSSIFLDSVINSVFSLKVNNKSLFGENGFIELLRSPSLFFVIVVLFVVLKVERQQLSSIGLCMSKKSVWHFINGFLYGGGSIVIVLFVLWCLGNLTITNSIFNPHFSDFEWVVLFTSSLFPGVGEELLFRGYFLNLIHNST